MQNAPQKKRLNVELDAQELKAATKVLDKLHISRSAVIAMLFGRIATTGSIPFELSLTSEERLQQATEQLITSDKTEVVTVNSWSELENVWEDET
jgi:addiction module RelB/DinJ family antitoxin